VLFRLPVCEELAPNMRGSVIGIKIRSRQLQDHAVSQALNAPDRALDDAVAVALLDAGTVFASVCCDAAVLGR
jgi:hypothetical protein